MNITFCRRTAANSSGKPAPASRDRAAGMLVGRFFAARAPLRRPRPISGPGQPISPPRRKVIFLFMYGGPSQSIR